MTLEDNNRQVDKAVFDSLPSEHLAALLMEYQGSVRRGMTNFKAGEVPFSILCQSLKDGEDLYRAQALDLLHSFYYREGPIMRSLHALKDPPFGYADVDIRPRGMVDVFQRYQPDPNILPFATSEEITEQDVECGIGFLDPSCLQLLLVFRGKVMVFLVLSEKESGNLWEIEEISQDTAVTNMIDFEAAFSWETFLANILRRQFTLPGAQAETLLFPERAYWAAPFDEERANRFLDSGEMRHSPLSGGYVADRHRTRKDIKSVFLRG